MSKFSTRIRTKFTVFIFILLLCTGAIFSLITVRIMNQSIRQEILKRAESLSRSAASAAAYSVLSNDFLAMDHAVFQGKQTNRDVEFMAIVDAGRKVIAHSDINFKGEILPPAAGDFQKHEGGTGVREIEAGEAKYLEVETPIRFKDKRLGAVLVRVNESALLQAQHRAAEKILGGAAITLVLGFVGVLLLSNFITRPIQELALGVEELKRGKRTRPLRAYGNDELGDLTDSFNRMSSLITEQQAKLLAYTQELQAAYLSTLRVLAAAIDARDPSTLGHSARVAMTSAIIGQEIGLAKEDLEELEIACLFHDVGKLRTPDAILLKSDALDSAEFDEMRRHPEAGAEILERARSLQKYIPSIRHHHEYYNGNGYPDGLEGDTIPLFAAIISIADAFDAMTSVRPYKPALDVGDALRELQDCAGRQFHPRLVQAFVHAMENGNRPALDSHYFPKVI
jgi:putative nucleotidyltransferase with HDIG domain